MKQQATLRKQRFEARKERFFQSSLTNTHLVIKTPQLRQTFVDYEPRNKHLLLSEAKQDSELPAIKPSAQKRLTRRLERIEGLADLSLVRMQFL